MLRITLSALVASLVAFTLTANSPVSTEVQVANCNAGDPTCDGRSVPVLIASCNPGDPTCGRSLAAKV